MYHLLLFAKNTLILLSNNPIFYAIYIFFKQVTKIKFFGLCKRTLHIINLNTFTYIHIS